jgi:hypothetical protein
MLHCRAQGQTGAGTGIEDITYNIPCLFFWLKLCLVITFDMFFFPFQLSLHDSNCKLSGRQALI